MSPTAPGLHTTAGTLEPVPVAAVAPAPLVLVAHGTRDVRGAPLLGRVAERVGGLLPGTDVRHGWVEFQRPSAAEALAGSAGPVVVPLFLGGGYHVEHDLPRLVRAHGSGRITAHLGPEPIIVEAVAGRLREALASEGAGVEELDGVVLAAAGSRRRAPVAETETAARGLSRLLGTPVRPAYLSAAEPSARRAVRRWRSEGARTLAVATYLLAEGHFSRALHGAGADLVAPPLGDHPAVAEVVARRYRAATVPAAGGAQAGTAVLHTRARRPPHGADGASRLHAADRALTGSTGARP